MESWIIFDAEGHESTPINHEWITEWDDWTHTQEPICKISQKQNNQSQKVNNHREVHEALKETQ